MPGGLSGLLGRNHVTPFGPNGTSDSPALIVPDHELPPSLALPNLTDSFSKPGDVTPSTESDMNTDRINIAESSQSGPEGRETAEGSANTKSTSKYAPEDQDGEGETVAGNLPGTDPRNIDTPLNHKGHQDIEDRAFSAILEPLGSDHHSNTVSPRSAQAFERNLACTSYRYADDNDQGSFRVSKAILSRGSGGEPSGAEAAAKERRGSSKEVEDGGRSHYRVAGMEDQAKQVELGKASRWHKLRDFVENDEGLKRDIKFQKTLFRQQLLAENIETPGQLIQAIRQRRKIFMPNSEFKKYWDISSMFVLLYLAFVIPFRIAFSVQTFGLLYYIDILIDIYFVADVCINFRTAYIDTNMKVEADPVKCAVHYLKSWFVVDIVSIVPMDYAVRGLEGTFVCSLQWHGCGASETNTRPQGAYFKAMKMLRLFRITKLVKLLKTNAILEKYQDAMISFQQIVSTLKILFAFVFSGHLMGCMFYLISTDEFVLEHERELVDAGILTTWLHGAFGTDYESVEISARYMAALYWAFTTMSTVGYGDISASTTMERGYAIFAMIGGGLLFSTMLGYVLAEVEVEYSHQKVQTAKLKAVMSYTRRVRLDRDSRVQVLAHFRNQEVQAFDERALLFEMPFDLRAKILNKIYGPIVAEVALFSDEDDVFITELCSRVAPMSYMKGVFIYKKNEMAKTLYIVVNGEVDLQDGWGNTIFVCSRGAYFGEGALLGDSLRRSDHARSRSECNVLEVKSEDMEDVMQAFPEIEIQMRTMFEKRKAEFNRRSMELAAKQGQVGSKKKRSSLLFSVDEDFDQNKAKENASQSSFANKRIDSNLRHSLAAIAAVQQFAESQEKKDAAEEDDKKEKEGSSSREKREDVLDDRVLQLETTLAGMKKNLDRVVGLLERNTHTALADRR